MSGNLKLEPDFDKEENLQSSEVESANAPKGLGGWLILVGFGLCKTLIISLPQFFKTYAELIFSGDWIKLSQESVAPWFPFFILFEFLGSVASIVFALIATIYFFRKSKKFKKWYVVFLGFNACFMLLDLIIVYQIAGAQDLIDHEIFTVVGGALVGALIWIPYVMVSERVRNTFVR